MSIVDFLDQQKVLYPELNAAYENFSNLYQQKLWHQLSDLLFEFLGDIAGNCRGNSFLDLYIGFIKDFESKLSSVRFAQLASMIGSSLTDSEAAIQFFQTLLERRKRLGLEASMCMDMDIVLLKVKAGENSEAKIMLEESKELLQKVSSTERVVFSKYYKAETEYRKIIGPPQEFYKAALMFLVYTPADTLPQEERYIL